MDTFINFITILLFIWDLKFVLFHSHKDLVSRKTLDFGNILGVLVVYWSQKWTKTINFGYVSFLFKHLILKKFSDTVFFLWDTYLW